MKNSFIPVNNSIDKMLAFAPTLSQSYRKSQLIKSVPNYIETADMIIDLQKTGWKIEGVCENRDKKTRQISNNYVKLHHPDLTMKNNKGQTECLSNIYLTNSTTGNTALQVDYGLYRLVCSNGMITGVKEDVGRIPHNEKGVRDYQFVINNVNKIAKQALTSFDNFKNKILTSKQIQKLAADALKVRFGKVQNINSEQLLNIHREEDKGDDLWTVFNRIQENLTKSNMLVDINGKLLTGTTNNIKQDIDVNQKLYNLVEAYA
jgi:cell fate (sporulation/competence/biofilm development) regulator YlbF (YheA/YmcA/DUF963 family)